MKTRIITVLLLSIAALAGVAQTRSVQFSYDHAGNRTSRAIVLPAAAQSRRAPIDSTQTEVFTDIFAEYQLHVYPNPTHGELKIELRGLPEGASYHLLIASMSGQVIISRNTTENPTLADLTECPAGIYIMRIQYKDYKKDFKIIRL